jgi:toxin ParE1/3/4
MRIRWTPAAAADFEHIFEYLQQHLPHLARPTIIRIYERIRSLRKMPFSGRPGRKEGTRELVLAPLPYLVLYRVKDEFIEVVHIYHGAQNRS